MENIHRLLKAMWWEKLEARGPTPETRLRAVRMFVELNHLSWREAEQIDQGLVEACYDDEALVESAKRVCYNGVCDPGLFERFKLEELGALMDAPLRCSALARLEEAQHERERYMSAMLREKYDNVSASAAGSFLRCRTCRGTEVSWQQKQTRGADESMTIFCTCGSCGARWKMS